MIPKFGIIIAVPSTDNFPPTRREVDAMKMQFDLT